MPIGVYERKLRDPVLRFMGLIDPEPNTGCWLWSGSCNEEGYGRFKIGLKSDNSLKIIKAHRFSYETFVGPIPEGMKILHKCDNPPCVNWEHLFLGTNQDNSRDMFLKRRGVKSKRGLPYGVRIERSGKFVGQTSIDGKQTHLGTFDTPEEASEVALKKKFELINNKCVVREHALMLQRGDFSVGTTGK